MQDLIGQAHSVVICNEPDDICAGRGSFVYDPMSHDGRGSHLVMRKHKCHGHQSQNSSLSTNSLDLSFAHDLAGPGYKLNIGHLEPNSH
ncbi:hypothetical protein VM1G_11748 [Cytospora mali]|uniref:Uncharacterized protein n=1 Tax=Cytospora mali TaxID=578113 RepID=A0A194W4N9_CYTMA|nr:hypothetical protein VM1G_11748 [Valsa mali]